MTKTQQMLDRERIAELEAKISELKEIPTGSKGIRWEEFTPGQQGHINALEVIAYSKGQARGYHRWTADQVALLESRETALQAFRDDFASGSSDETSVTRF